MHGIGKGLDLSIQPEKQYLKPTVDRKMKEIFQIKPRLGQGRAGLRWKIKPQYQLINLLHKQWKTHQKFEHPIHLKHKIKLYQ